MSTRTCTSCGTPSTAEKPLKLCTACKTVCYCDRDCQKKHWKFHKGPCKNFSEPLKTAPKFIVDEGKDGSLLIRGVDGEPDILIPGDTYFFRDVPPTPEYPKPSARVIWVDPAVKKAMLSMTEQEREALKEKIALQQESRKKVEIEEEAAATKAKFARVDKAMAEFHKRSTDGEGENSPGS